MDFCVKGVRILKSLCILRSNAASVHTKCHDSMIHGKYKIETTHCKGNLMIAMVMIMMIEEG